MLALKKAAILGTIAGLALQVFSPPADACTAITLKVSDGTVIQARTEEWGAFDLKSQLMIMALWYLAGQLIIMKKMYYSP